jgi:hypothetical protein
MSRKLTLLSLVVVALAACESPAAAPDAGVDAGLDAGDLDSGADAGSPEDAGPRDAGARDPALVDECVACHGAEGEAWQAHLSSHRLVLFCTTCHEASLVDAGVGHARARPCADCHSSASHPAPEVRCTSCHDPHGTANLYLIRERLDLGDAGSLAIRFTSLEGASPDGLVREGVPDAAVGTGLCEACHTATAHYTRAGGPDPHSRSLCTECHTHDVGFTAPP